MGTSRTKSIEEIDDLSEMYKVTEALGISCKVLNSLDQMKAKVKEELNRSVDRPSWKAGQVKILFQFIKVREVVNCVSQQQNRLAAIFTLKSQHC